MREIEAVLNRPQQAVVILRNFRTESADRFRGDDQGGHVPTPGITAATGVGRPLIPGDEEDAAIAERRRSGDGGNDALQPRVTGGDGTIVGVTAHVGRDPHEVRDLAVAHVHPELRERHDVRGAARRVVADVGVVDEGIVLHRVVAGRGPQVARRGHVFHVGLPGTAARFHLVRDVGRAHEAGGAVARDPERAARREGKVIWQAGMGCPVVVGGQAVRGGQAVDKGRGGVADHGTVLMVFHHDDKYVREGRDRRRRRDGWGRGLSWGGGSRGERRRGGEGGRRRGRRQGNGADG